MMTSRRQRYLIVFHAMKSRRQKGKEAKGECKMKYLEFILIYGWAILVIVIAVGAMLYFKPWDNNKVEYCLEWNNNIQRENLFFSCIDLQNMQLKCIYEIQDDQRLIVQDLDGNAVLFNCSKYIMATEVPQ